MTIAESRCLHHQENSKHKSLWLQRVLGQNVGSTPSRRQPVTSGLGVEEKRHKTTAGKMRVHSPVRPLSGSSPCKFCCFLTYKGEIPGHAHLSRTQVCQFLRSLPYPQDWPYRGKNMALESDGARAQIQAVYPWQANCRFFSVKWEPQCHLMLNETSVQKCTFQG